MVFGLLCFFSQLIIMPAFAGIFAGEIHEKKNHLEIDSDVIWDRKYLMVFFEISIPSFSNNDISTILSVLTCPSERKVGRCIMPLPAFLSVLLTVTLSTAW